MIRTARATHGQRRRLRKALALAVPAGLAAGFAVSGVAVVPAAAASSQLTVTQVASPAPFDQAGQVVRWTTTVTNSGDSALKLTDISASWPGLSCTPVGVGGTLRAGASIVCTTTFEVAQSDLDHRWGVTDVVTVTAAIVGGGGTITKSASATSLAQKSPGLSMTASANPAAASRPGQSVAYTFGVRNKGNVTLHGLVVSAPFHGLSALVCSPVPLGGDLAPGVTTTCRATRTMALADLRTTALTETAKATARVVRTSVGAAAAVRLTVDALPPVATDDSVPAVAGGPDVFLPGATNDRPGEPGGPTVDPSSMVFLGVLPDAVWDGKRITTPDGFWSILPDGRVRFEPDLYRQNPVGEVDYRVFDTAGRSAVGHLRVPIRKQASAGPSAVVTTPPNQPVTVDVLSRDDPGEDPDGTSSSFDRGSLRLTGLSPTKGYPTTYATDATSISIGRVGDYRVGSDGRITFTPAADYAGTPPTVRYSALSTAGSRVTSSLTVAVGQPTPPVAPTNPVPVATDDHAVTTTQLSVVLAAQSNDIAPPGKLDNGKLTFPGDQLKRLPAGSTIAYGNGVLLTVPGEGTYHAHWNTQDVEFTPTDGFVGETTPVEYRISDYAGNTDRATSSVTVLRGASAQPDTVTTRQNHPVTFDVRANDDPGARPGGGSAGWSDCCFPKLTDIGLPEGSEASWFNEKLTVPGEGVYTVNPGKLTVTFDPEPQFRGAASPVRLRLQAEVPFPYGDPRTIELSSILRVTVLPADPIARADTATSDGLGHPVVVSVLDNDSAGSPVAPLVGSSVRLRLLAGMPAGTTLYGDAKRLVIPEHGMFLAAGNGEITFVPLSRLTGTPAVGYQVADTNGTTARSSLEVTVG